MVWSGSCDLHSLELLWDAWQSDPGSQSALAQEIVDADGLVLLLSITQQVDRLPTNHFAPSGAPGSLRSSDIAILLLEGISKQYDIRAGQHKLEDVALLIHPFISSNELIWPIHIVYHSREEPHVTVMDAIETDVHGDMERVRHLIIGVWGGPNSFRESEVPLTKPLGASLENFYTCTLAGVCYYHTLLVNNPKILIIGLGGGSLCAFFGRYMLSSEIDAVEIEDRVAKVAEMYFGLKCNPAVDSKYPSIYSPAINLPGIESPRSPCIKLPGDYPTLPSTEVTSGPKRSRRKQFTDVSAEGQTPTRVSVANAIDFLRMCEHKFDFIVVDTYTSGEFPIGLLNQSFFDSLAACTCETGGIAINGGILDDAKAVKQFLSKSFPSDSFTVESLIDEESTQVENVTFYVAPNDRSMDEWKNTVGNLPFKVGALTKTDSGTKLFWKSNNERNERVKQQVVFAPPTDDVWGLFD